jgi:hypothetical protein
MVNSLNNKNLIRRNSIMNLKNLKEKQEIKNYKVLCELLEEPIKTGKSKQLQLKDFERYFEYLFNIIS